MTDKKDGDVKVRTYTESEVARALSVVSEVMLNRVHEGLLEVTYGQEITRGKDDKPKIRMVVDWKDVENVINELRVKED